MTKEVKYQVAVIVPAYNEEKNISACLDSLILQSCKSIEIIVVDDGSSDHTVNVVESYLHAHNIQLLKQEHMGPAQARNFAATVTSADIFVFMDADMIASPDYVAKLIQPILNNTAKGTFTLCEYVANKGTYLADTWSIAGGCEIGTRVGKNHPLEQPVFRALLKNEFLRVEGYSEEGQGAVGEDILLGKKLGYLAHAAPHAVCYHSNPSDLCDFIASAVWYGKGWAYRKSFLQFMKMVLGLLPPVSLIRRLVNFSWFYLPGLLLYDIALLYGALASLGNQKIAK